MGIWGTRVLRVYGGAWGACIVRYQASVCFGMAEPVGCAVGYWASVCLGMAEPMGCVVGIGCTCAWVWRSLGGVLSGIGRVCLGLAEVRVCWGVWRSLRSM